MAAESDAAAPMPVANRTMPPAALMPVLDYPDLAAAIDWLGRAFGFSERWRVGEHRAVLQRADGAVMLSGDIAQPRPQSVMVRVVDADAACEQARAAGADVTDEPRDHPYGERQFSAVDPAGHRWTFTQSVADLAPEEWGGVSGPALTG